MLDLPIVDLSRYAMLTLEATSFLQKADFAATRQRLCRNNLISTAGHGQHFHEVIHCRFARIELVGGLAVMIGLQTRLAAFLCSGTMAVAYFQFHWKFQMGSQIFPSVNQGELAALYSFVFLAIACRGAGIWGLDRQD